MAAAILIAAAACSSPDSTKVFTVAGEAAAQAPTGSSPGTGAGAAAAVAEDRPAGAGAKSARATPGSASGRNTAGTAGTGHEGTRSDGRTDGFERADGDAAARIADAVATVVPVTPSPSATPNPAASPPASEPPVAEAPVAEAPVAEAPASEPPMVLAAPAGTSAPRRVVEPEAAPSATPASGGRPADGIEVVPVPSGATAQPATRPGSTAQPQAQGGSASAPVTGPVTGWGRPVLTEDFPGSAVGSTWTALGGTGSGPAASVSGGVLHLAGDLASPVAQVYGRWEVRLRAAPGSGSPAALLLLDPPGRNPSGDPSVRRHDAGAGDGSYTGRQDGAADAEIALARMDDPGRRSATVSVLDGYSGGDVHRVRADFTGWHTVAVDRLPTGTTFWLDGRRVWSSREVGSAGRSMRLVLRGDAGCGAGTCDGAVTLDVDWVRIYRAPR
ncbi:hypothetical protein JOL79_00135 [Microbispora sp. RL4-1S]|uniref:GH16 domain-containing protein n=1 Tax=Microbispora oryzae TaxID=2806554 RepID=A0A940WCU7_9ACTN|nr:glycoside hydrolase family 16 protein [Microbispora oryzae]MBP2702203.1 hypothetical protein [Microbispora oryzae]